MAFKTPAKKKPAQEQEKVYRKLGSMWNSKHFEGHDISTDDYAGDLIFRDKESGKFYKVKRISLFEPKVGQSGKKPPKDLIYNLLINLNNEYDVEEMGEDGVDEENPG